MNNFNFRKAFAILGITIGSLIILGLIIALICIKSVDKHEFGYTFNRFTGEVKPLNRTGWIVYNPLKQAVHAIDCRPYQVQINASFDASQRILNAKLVQFNPEGLMTFIEWHGRKAGNQVANLKEILKCYAFDVNEGRDCPFLTVKSTLAPSQGMSDN